MKNLLCHGDLASKLEIEALMTKFKVLIYQYHSERPGYTELHKGSTEEHRVLNLSVSERPESVFLTTVRNWNLDLISLGDLASKLEIEALMTKFKVLIYQYHSGRPGYTELH